MDENTALGVMTLTETSILGDDQNRKYARQWKVRSYSESKKAYTVSRRKDGGWECSCPGWVGSRRKKQGFECKHIRRARLFATNAKVPVMVGLVQGKPTVFLTDESVKNTKAFLAMSNAVAAQLGNAGWHHPLATFALKTKTVKMSGLVYDELAEAMEAAVGKNGREYWTLEKGSVYLNGYGHMNSFGIGKTSMDVKKEVERLLRMA